MVWKVAVVFLSVCSFTVALYNDNLFNLALREYQDELKREQELNLLSRLYEKLQRRSAWDSYIDNLIGQSKTAEGKPQVDKAVIIGMDGSIWTSNNGGKFMQITPGEAKDISKAFKSKDFTSFMSSGVHLEGEKYSFLREEDDKIVFAKKKGIGGVTLQASKTAIVIGHVPEKGAQGNLNKAVNVIAEYLESMGY